MAILFKTTIYHNYIYKILLKICDHAFAFAVSGFLKAVLVVFISFIYLFSSCEWAIAVVVLFYLTLEPELLFRCFFIKLTELVESYMTRKIKKWAFSCQKWQEFTIWSIRQPLKLNGLEFKHPECKDKLVVLTRSPGVEGIIEGSDSPSLWRTGSRSITVNGKRNPQGFHFHKSLYFH